MTSSPRGVLLVEDDEHDTFFMQRAMSRAGLQPPIHVAINGQEAIDYLSGAEKYADRNAFPLPGCIFLDLKLPFLNGFEVLEWIGSKPSLKPITVFILTSSPEESDRKRAAELGAKAYLVKPANPQMLLDVLSLAPECLSPGPGSDASKP